MVKGKKTILGAILCTLMALCLSVGVMFAMPTKAFANEEGFGIILGDETSIKGEKNEAQDDFLEYVIVADLTAGTTFQLCDFGSGSTWTELNIDEASTPNLTINEDDVYEVTADGEYTIYLKMISFGNNEVFVSYNAPAPTYEYTTYENWQIKYGNVWDWSDNMEKVEDGLFKIEILWEGTGFNVKSDENPINKDWFALEELTIGEGVKAPVNVDVYLRIIDDETLMIGIGVAPTVPAAPIEMTIAKADISTAFVGEVYIILNDKDSTAQMFFDIAGDALVSGKTYTLSDMIPDYTGIGDSEDYSVWTDVTACTFTPTLDPDGKVVSIDATMTTVDGDVYHITYTAPEPKDVTVTAIDWSYDKDGCYDVYVYSEDTTYLFELTDETGGLTYGTTYTFTDMVPDWTCTLDGEGYPLIEATDATLTVTKDEKGLVHIVATMVLDVDTHTITYDELAATTYAITNGTAEGDAEKNHGYISIDRETATEGETVTVTVNPASGYQLKSLTVAAATVMARPITPTPDEQDKTKYTFTMPAHDVKVIAEFETTPATVEVVDDHGIIIQPAKGETKEYNRLATNTCFYYDSSIKLKYQSGTVTMVECADGTVYWKDPISAYTSGAWIKGKKEGSTITFATKQPVFYKTTYKVSISVRWGYFNDGHFSADDNYADSFIFDIDGDSLIMRGTQATTGSTSTHFPGIFWDDDDSFYGDGDCGVTLTAPAPTYAISDGTAEDANGSISFDKATAAEGETVTVTVTPNEGYQLKSLKYNDGEDHTITVDKDGKYTFTMPAHDVKVIAEFEEASTSSTVFASLEELVTKSPATDVIQNVTVTITDAVIDDFYVSSKGYTNGIYVTAVGTTVEIYCNDVPATWEVGGKVSGTIKAEWLLYKDTAELQKWEGGWNAFTYTAPAPVVTVADILPEDFPTSDDGDAPLDA